MNHHWLEIAWLIGYLLTLGWMLQFASRRKKGPATPEGVKADIMSAVGAYLCGSNDLSKLKSLAASHPADVQDNILRYQALVAGHRDELGSLAVQLGLVQSWWYDAQGRNAIERRKAFASLAALAHCESVQRMSGDVARKAFQGTEDEVRVDAARILLAGGNPDDVRSVFAAALSMPPDAHTLLGAELARHAAALCKEAIPRALQSEDPLPVLEMLTSWQCALPVDGLGCLTRHDHHAIRLEAVRLLRYLPATAENYAAVLAALADEDAEIREAAAGAIRLGSPKLDCPANAAASVPYDSMAKPRDAAPHAWSCDEPFPALAARCETPNPFAHWRLLDA